MRRLNAALLGLAALAAAGCGKSDLATTTSASTPARATAKAPAAPSNPATPGGSGSPGAPGASGGPGASGVPGESGGAGESSAPGTSTSPPARTPKVPGSPPVSVPLALTAARAVAFAHAVRLTSADVPGAQELPPSKTPAAREREAARCGGQATPTVGGGRSADLQRGHGLERETISSSVTVLDNAHSVERDLAYAATTAGLKCYRDVLTRSLKAEADPNIKLLGVAVAPLRVSIAGAGRAEGIRIVARVGVPGPGVVLRLFVDAITLPYGPAELDLFGTSFVQPVPERTEEELLTLLHQRALTQNL
jgi:hypothetical protein